MAKLTRRDFIKRAAGATLGASAATAMTDLAGAGRRKRPNILLLLSDQHTIRHTPAYGYDHVRTPNLDYLASHGVTFMNSYCASPLCGPARASIHTGRMPHVTRVNNNAVGNMDWTLPNMGDAVRNAGYATAWAGKLHLGGAKPGDNRTPTPPGKKKPSGLAWSYYPTSPDGIPGFENLNYIGAMKEYAQAKYNFDTYNVGMDVDRPVAEEAIEYLKRDHDKPFFLVVSIMNPHDICFWESIRDRHKFPVTPKNENKLPPLPANHLPSIGEAGWVDYRRNVVSGKTHSWTARQWREYIHAYNSYVEDCDKTVGKILVALRARGLEDDTVIIYTSDHGEGVAAHKWRQKMGPFEEEIAVPFTVTWKGRTPSGVVDKTHLVSGVDIFPTVCAFAGAKVPASVEGISLKGLIDNPSQPGHDHVVVELGTVRGSGNPEEMKSGGNGRVIRTREYKYLRFDTEEEMLFDLKIDPGEMENLAADPKFASILKSHRKILARYVKETNDHFKMEGVVRKPAQDEFPDESQTSNEPTRLTDHPDFPDRPSGTDELHNFQCPKNWGDNYGTRVRGYVHPPRTGDYHFFLNCANAGQLWLSTDSNPTNRKKEAWVIAGTPDGAWKSQPRATTRPIPLKRGKKYYIEVLHHAGRGDDHLTVAWWNKTLKWQAPIPGNFLSTPSGKKGRILREYWRMKKRS